MGVSKVSLEGITLVDLTSDTVSTNNLLVGGTAVGASGNVISGVAQESRIDEFLNGTISGEYVNDDMTIVGKFAFAYCDANDFSVSLPNVTELDSGAFRNSNLTAAYLPKVTTLSSGSASHFAYCKKLTSIDLSKVDEARPMMFDYCSSLVNVNVKGMTKTYYNGAIFRGCTSLETIVIPANNGLYSDTFKDCTNLKYIDTSANTFNGCFGNCSSLQIIVNRYNGVCGMNNPFQGSSIAQGGSGAIMYVPQSMVASYNSATNWSVYVGYGTLEFRSIEGSTYEHYYVDGTPIEE